MLVKAVRRRLGRLSVLLAVPLAAVLGAVLLTGAPAQASYTYQGLFYISDGSFCLGTLGGGTANQTPIVLGSCGPASYTQWSIFWVSDGYYQLQPHNAEYPINKCMDTPDSNPVVYIYGCHGGHQQRWSLNPNTSDFQQIRQVGTNNCLSEHTPLGAGYVTAERVSCGFGPQWRLFRVP